MKILVRLDDFSPNRKADMWARVEAVLDRYGIRPIVAVIPNDRYFGPAATTDDFWQQVQGLQAKGWAIGLHGDTHLVRPIAPGLEREIFFATKSEFVGLPLEEQVRKLESTWQEFMSHGVRPVAFIAPNHGFDANTVRAVAQQGAMPFISDGISLRLFKDRGLIWLPQLDWRIPRLRCGFRTVCLHPSTMDAAELVRFEAAARAVRTSFVSVADIEVGRVATRGVADLVFERLFALFFHLKESVHRFVAATSAERRA